MSKVDMTVPPHVARALEELENASSPTGIGAAYTVLEWRSSRPRRGMSVQLYEIVGAIVFIAIVILIARVGALEISDFWRGVAFGASLTTVTVAIRDWSSRRSNVTVTLVERVDQAIDRWRHAVPAMRDFPK